MEIKMKSVDWVLFSVDPVIFIFDNNELSVLLVQRSQEPFKDLWSLPGGRVDKENCINLTAALKEKLEYKTGIRKLFFEQLKTYGANDMDPRGWSVTTAYLALTHKDEISFTKNKYSKLMRWVPLTEIQHAPKMAFWHKRIILDAFTRLKDKSLYTDLPVNFMPRKFTYPELKNVYEKILGIRISRQAFARRMDSANIFEDTGERQEGRSRPSPLYKKNKRGGAHVFAGLLKGSPNGKQI